jgi:AraC-like DNA-binding protein
MLRFRKLITSHVQDIHTTQDYAKLLNVSPNHLNKCVKSTIGKTASDLINEALLMEAKALLSMSQYSVAEVAFTLGFEDASYFSRFFKKHAVQSPTEYRRMIDLSC